MPNAIKYSLSGDTQSLKKGNFWIGVGDVGKGPTASTGYWNGFTPPDSGYTIYLSGTSGIPSVYPLSTDNQLISLTNTIGSQTFSTSTQCLNWFATQSDKMVVNIDYPPIVTSGLSLNLDAGFTPSYPRTGTTWYDVSTYVNNGTLINGPTYSTSGGGSIVFDGIDDIATIGVGTNYPYPYSTYEMWVKTAGLASGMTIAGLIGLDYGRLMFIDNIGRVQYVQYSGPSTVLVNTSVLPTNANLYDNSYHQIVCLRNTTSAEIYVDGVLQKTVSNGGNPSWDGLNSWSSMESQIANNPNNAIYRLSGSIPITRIYNRALSAAEVSQNYKAMFPRFLGTNIVTDGLRLITSWISLANLTSRTADSVMAPDGTMTATLFERVSISLEGNAQVRQTFPTVDLLPSTAYSISFWAKRISLTQVLIFDFSDTPQQIITLTNNWEFYIFSLTTNATFPVGEFIDIGSTATTAGSQLGEKYSIWKLHVSLI